MTVWSLPTDRASLLALATGYPFAIPSHSYVFENGDVRDWDPDADLSGRVPVLAIGSNQSPEQLTRKFDPRLGPQRIPVTRAWLADHDVVFATHISRYGAIPANLHAVPGMRVRLAVTWLDPEQLEIMHRTEIGGGNYRYVRLDGITLDLDHPGPNGVLRLDSVTAYLSPFGFMAHECKPISLAAIAAEGRPHRTATVAEALDLLRQRAGDDRSLEDFIGAAIEDEAMRSRLTVLIRKTSLSFNHPRFTLLEE